MPSGIYRLTCRPTNRSYIGLSKNIWHRWARHYYRLRAHDHGNNLLQREVNQHGLNSIVYEILEECEDSARLIEREQYWIEKLRPELNLLNAPDRENPWNPSTHPNEYKKRYRELNPNYKEKQAERQRTKS